MLSKVLTTPIDELVNLVKENKNCNTAFLRKKLNLPAEIIEKWLVILEEYKIIKIHYKGFEGMIELIEKKETVQNNDLDIDNLKETFTSKCKQRNLNYEQMGLLWPKFVGNYKGEIQKLFQSSAIKKGFNELQIEKAWVKYCVELEKY